jgi:hypothetical protein
MLYATLRTVCIIRPADGKRKIVDVPVIDSRQLPHPYSYLNRVQVGKRVAILYARGCVCIMYNMYVYFMYFLLYVQYVSVRKWAQRRGFASRQ